MSSHTSIAAEERARRHDLSELATKKVFKRLIPFLLLMYVIAFLDRSNVSFAQKEFETDFGISAASYAFGAGLFFVGYAIFEVPSNILLHKVGARWWLARIMVSWGIVAACFVFVQGETSFYILRFLLGVTEAGFFPGVILFLTYWIPARHLSRARGYFYMGIALAGILGNPLSGGLLELNGVLGLRGIQWMFLVEGLLAVVVGIWAYFYLTDHPKDAAVVAGRSAAGARGDHRGRGHRQVRRPWPAEGAGHARELAGLVLRTGLLLPPDRGLRRDLLPAHPGDCHHRAEARIPGLPGDRHPVGLRAGRGGILPGPRRPHPEAPNDRLRAAARDRLRDHHLGRLEQLPGAGHRRSVPGGDGVRGHVADLLDPADRVHDRIRRGRGHRLDQLPGQPGRLPGPDPARRLQDGVRRQRRPVRPLRRRVRLCDPVRAHRASSRRPTRSKPATWTRWTRSPSRSERP